MAGPLALMCCVGFVFPGMLPGLGNRLARWAGMRSDRDAVFLLIIKAERDGYFVGPKVLVFA